MSTHQAPLPHDSPLNRDFELDSVVIGPSARMIRMETDPQGGLYYQFARHRAKCLQMPRTFGSRQVAAMDMVNTAALLDPRTNQLNALVAFLAEGTRIIMMGRQWSVWIDDDLGIHREHDMPATIRSWHTPIILFEKKNLIAFELLLNIYNRDIYHPCITTSFREGRVNHTLQLLFHYPHGIFRMARVMIHEAQTGKLIDIFDLDEFPLIWPPPRRSRPDGVDPHLRGVRTPAAPTDRMHTARPDERTITNSDTIHDFAPEIQPHWGARADARPPRPAPPPEPEPPRPPPPLPSTEHLPVAQLLDVLAREEDLDRRWRMIESNLMLGRAERTYPMILKFTDLIAERTSAWAPVRLRAAFTPQPAALLGVFLHKWSVNQVLAVIDGHAEPQRIIDLLREREVERLMQLDTNLVPTSAHAARAILRIDRNADSQAIKKVWRTLLGFINADFGRREERPIHHKKDEVAKLLQAARNVLMRNG